VVNPKPTVNAGADKVFPYYTEFSLAPSYSSNVRRYEWSPADSLSCSTCPVPTTIATRLKTYTVKVTSDSGCVATDQIIVAIECKDAYLLMPTAFTPNNDGKNDFYYPLTRGIGAVKRFSVYNRSGQLVFDQQNFSPNKNTKGWSGRYNNTDQPAGTYVYILEAICEQGQSISKKGNFLLIR
jgi:gliding motility-associated-like protein